MVENIIFKSSNNIIKRRSLNLYIKLFGKKQNLNTFADKESKKHKFTTESEIIVGRIKVQDFQTEKQKSIKIVLLAETNILNPTCNLISNCFLLSSMKNVSRKKKTN